MGIFLHAQSLLLLHTVAMANVSYYIKPMVLQVDDKTKEILEKEGWMKFLNLFQRTDENLALHLVLYWEDGKVEFKEVSFVINQKLLAEIVGIPLVGDKIMWEKDKIELQLCKGEKNTLKKLQEGINRESLSLKWKNVFVVIMQYVTMDNHSPIVRSSTLPF